MVRKNDDTQYYYDVKNKKVLMIFDGMVDGEGNPEQKWYDYRDRAYEGIAKERCEKYNIDIVG